MKQYILICINEEKEVVSTESFASLRDAQKQMYKEYESQVADSDYIENETKGKHSAHLYYGTDLEYHWEIRTCDVPYRNNENENKKILSARARLDGFVQGTAESWRKFRDEYDPSGLTFVPSADMTGYIITESSDFADDDECDMEVAEVTGITTDCWEFENINVKL